MLELNIGQASESIIVTLNETKTLLNPVYLFVFTQVTTKEVVNYIRTLDDDKSNYPERYNEFILPTASLFGSSSIGEWHYKVYEQTDKTNTDPAQTTSLLECGKMYLYGSSPLSYTQYEQPVTYKAYNG